MNNINNKRILDGMRYPSIDKLIEKTGSKYKLVIGAAKRAKEIKRDNEKLLEKTQNKKTIGIALEEILNDKVKIIGG